MVVVNISHGCCCQVLCEGVGGPPDVYPGQHVQGGRPHQAGCAEQRGGGGVDARQGSRRHPRIHLPQGHQPG